MPTEVVAEMHRFLNKYIRNNDIYFLMYFRAEKFFKSFEMLDQDESAYGNISEEDFDTENCVLKVKSSG
jgi:outer membrane protein assembly factor BamD (BamD/ComL family)